MKVIVGYTTYVEIEIEIDDKFAPLTEDITKDNCLEQERLFSEMMSVIVPEIGETPDYVGAIIEDKEICIFEI